MTAAVASERDVFLEILRTHDAAHAGLAAFLKRHNLSPPQYNVLRILRGASPRGLTCGEIARRMITRDPDVTRLIDRLERAELVARKRGVADRRVVRVSLRPKGRRLLGRLDQPIDALHGDQFGHLSNRERGTLVRLLEKARRAAEQ